MPYAYVTLESMRLRLDIQSGDTGDDPTLRAVIEAASRKFEGMCGGRRFQPYAATMTYTATDSGEVEVDDLLSVDAMQVSGVAYTGYELEPVNAPYNREPYTLVVGDIPTSRRAVQITGTWGYWLELETVGATLAAGLSDSATAVTVTSGAAFERLQTLRIGAEDLYVTGINVNTLTVQRGQNGTAAASHSSGEVIQVYRYPAQAVEATALLAARQYRRSDAPLGVVGSDALGTAQRISSRENDAYTYAAELRRFRGAAVRG